MKKLILNFLKPMYEYYSSGGTKDIAYERSIITLQMILLLHTMSLIVLLGLGDIVAGYASSTTKMGRYIFLTFTFIIPSFLLFRFLFTEAEIKIFEPRFPLKWAKLLCLAYIIFAAILFAFSVFWKKGLL